MPTVAEVFEESRHLFGSVPPVSEEFVCPYCCGPVTGYRQCYHCLEYFVRGPVPGTLHTRLVPMTIVLEPSGWYTRLYNYKRLRPDYQPAVAALAWTYLSIHEDKISGLLGGEPTVTTIVPSTRDQSFEEQGLVRALRLVEPLRERLVHTCSHDGTTQLAHGGALTPSAFLPGPTSVRGERVLLIEDTWITGSRALSVACALLGWGAESVAIVPIARICHETKDASFVARAQEPYDPHHWPR